MKIKAWGKVNLALDIVGRRPDGYHELDMIMAPISLYDLVEVEPNGTEADVISCSGMELPEDSTVHRALQVLRTVRPFGGYTVRVQKHIPSQAGLAGGSADGAAVLKAVNELEGLGLDAAELNVLAARVGADVPFCLVNQFARVQGIGEVISPVDTNGWSLDVLLVKPEGGVSTPAAFSAYDAGKPLLHDVDLVQAALERQDPALLFSTMANGLEAAADGLCEQLEQVRADMLETGIVRVMMTGSGSCMMGFSVDRDVLEAACASLKDKYPFVQVVKVGVQA